MPVVRTLRVRVDRVQFSAARLSAHGPVVKWYYAAFALLNREFDSPQVHMIEVKDFETIKNEEIDKRKEIEERLSKLSGFLRLSDKQRQYILSSFYIQQRAERGTDRRSVAQIQSMPKEFNKFVPGDNKYINYRGDQALEGQDETNKYKLSQLAIMNTNCHQAIEKLGEINGDGNATTEDWKDFGPIASYEDLDIQVRLLEENQDFPFAVQLWDTKLNGRHEPLLAHSMLLLGRDTFGDLIIWEKSGFNMPFQLNNLRNVFSAYSSHGIWKMRALNI